MPRAYTRPWQGVAANTAPVLDAKRLASLGAA